MAKQKGIIKIEGTIGDISFYKSKDGFMAREKGGVDASKIANDPAFKRTRENNAEFGRAGKAGKILRTAFRALLIKSADSRMVSRLTKAMMAVIHLDQTSSRGLRNVIDGETELLLGFEFNTQSSLTTTILAPYTATLDRVTGNAAVAIDPFIPEKMVANPTGATHFKLFLGASAVDFEQGTFSIDSTESNYLPLNNQPTVAINLQLNLPAASTHPLFLALGIEFLQEVNGQKYPLNNGAFNACSLVKVNGS